MVAYADPDIKPTKEPSWWDSIKEGFQDVKDYLQFYDKNDPWDGRRQKEAEKLPWREYKTDENIKPEPHEPLDGKIKALDDKMIRMYDRGKKYYSEPPKVGDEKKFGVPENYGVYDKAKTHLDLFNKRVVQEPVPFGDYGEDERIKRESRQEPLVYPATGEKRKEKKKTIPKPPRPVVKSTIKRLDTQRKAKKLAPKPITVKPNFSDDGYDLRVRAPKPVLTKPMPQLVGPKRSTPAAYTELRRKLEQFTNREQQVDLKPLFAFLDAWNGTNLAAAYQRPISAHDREVLALNAQFELAKLDQDNVRAELDRDTLEMNKAKALLTDKLGNASLAADIDKTKLGHKETMKQLGILGKHYRSADSNDYMRNKTNRLQLDHEKFMNRVKIKQTDDANFNSNKRYELLNKLIDQGYTPKEGMQIMGENVVLPAPKDEKAGDPSKSFNTLAGKHEQAINSVIGDKINQLTNGGHVGAIDRVGQKVAIEKLYTQIKQDDPKLSSNEALKEAMRIYSDIAVNPDGTIKLDAKGRPYKMRRNNDLRK